MPSLRFLWGSAAPARLLLSAAVAAAGDRRHWSCDHCVSGAVACAVFGSLLHSMSAPMYLRRMARSQSPALQLSDRLVGLFSRTATERGLLATVVLGMSVLTGCGTDTDLSGERQPGAESQPAAERVKACLRNSGARIEQLPAPRVSHVPSEKERFRVALTTGESAGIRVLTSGAAAERQARAHLKAGVEAILQKGPILLGYSGRPAGTGLLEDCLRASDNGDYPERGEIARQLRRVEKRREARSGGYRQRQYDTPAEISQQLKRLRSYRRYRLYYLGERYGDLPLTAIVSKLQPPAYEPSTKRLPAPTSPTFGFRYGECEPPSDREGGCSPPLYIQNFEICAVSPKSYHVTPSGLTARIRGAPVFTNTGAGSLNVFTGQTTITIFASPPVAVRAANDVRSIDGSVAPGSKLPTPVPGALEGRLRCRPPSDDG